MDEIRYIHVDTVEYTAKVSALTDEGGTGVAINITGNGIELNAKKYDGQDQIVFTSGVDSANDASMTLAKNLAWELYQTDNFTVQS